MNYLDTHVVIWLFSGKMDKFPARVTTILRSEELRISPVVELEIQMLYESRKINFDAVAVISALQDRIGLVVCEEPIIAVVHLSLNESWTRDPFDRIIVGHAKSQRARLLTKDVPIREHYPKALWD